MCGNGVEVSAVKSNSPEKSSLFLTWNWWERAMWAVRCEESTESAPVAGDRGNVRVLIRVYYSRVFNELTQVLYCKTKQGRNSMEQSPS